MKKLLFRSLMIMGAMVAAITGFASCSGGSDDEPTPSLDVSIFSINIDANGGTESIQITSNTKWAISGGTSWCKVSQQMGEGNDYIDVDISENSSTEQRSCTLRVRTTDGSLSQDISVKQDGAKVSLSVDKSSISFTSAQGEKETLSIKANMSWAISGVPDWLNASTTSGAGNSSITLTTKSANNTATSRTATFTITSGATFVQVDVLQEGGLSACVVRPTNIVALGTQLACDWSYSSNTKYYLAGLWKKTAIERMTDNEIIAKLEDEERSTPKDNYVTSWKNLSSNTSFVLCTIAYDKDDNRGELIKQEITTRKEQSLEPIAEINYLKRSTDNKMQWSVTPSGKCSIYHMISGVDVSDAAVTCYDVVYAWLIENYINNKKYGLFSNYTIDLNILREGAYWKSITTPLYSETNAFVATWGKFSDLDGGDYSSTITISRGYFKAISSSAKIHGKARTTKAKNSTITKSETDLRIFRNLEIK